MLVGYENKRTISSVEAVQPRNNRSALLARQTVITVLIPRANHRESYGMPDLNSFQLLTFNFSKR